MGSNYRTGDADTDASIEALVARVGRADDADVLAEMATSILRMGTEGLDRGELKLVNATLKEIRYAFGVFEPYHHVRKVSIFGSARTKRDDPAYQCAFDLGAALAAQEWMIMTGAGPGVMEAGIEGAGARNSFGINIVLPFEASAAPVILDDPKLINFKYFFTRKLTFMKESHAFALLPGGFGTMDESFELLTLMQTGKQPLAPVVLLDPPGETYWLRWLEFVRDELLDGGLVSPADLSLVKLTDSVDEAVAEICGFYRNYHSMRYVGTELVLRMQSTVSDDLLEELNDAFGDIVVSGRIERAQPTNAEIRDKDQLGMARLSMVFNNASFSRLRALIDTINRN